MDGSGHYSRRAGAARRVAIGACVGILTLVSGARGQVPGENVNMVSGRDWPGGDPFLQRQNEPSLAVLDRSH